LSTLSSGISDARNGLGNIFLGISRATHLNKSNIDF
jgi:hypothetical protein